MDGKGLISGANRRAVSVPRKQYLSRFFKYNGYCQKMSSCQQ